MTARFSLATADGIPVGDLLAKCRLLGLDAVEASWTNLDAESRLQLQEARRSGIQTATLDLGLVGDVSMVEKELDEIADFAATVGCRRFTLSAADRPHERLDGFVAGLQRLAGRTEPRGIALAVRAASKAEAPRGAIRSTADIRTVLNRANRGNVVAQANLEAFAAAGENAAHATADLTGRLGHAVIGDPGTLSTHGYTAQAFLADLSSYGYADVVAITIGDQTAARSAIDALGGNRTIDSDRIGMAQRLLCHEGLDAIVVSASENIVSLTGYWPMNGTVVAFIPRDGEPHLLVPSGEETWASRSGWLNVHVYQAGRVQDPPFADSIQGTLARLASSYRLHGAAIGVEGGFRALVPPHMAHEVSGRHDVVRTVVGEVFGTVPRPLGDAYIRMRAAKTVQELRCIRRTAAIADVGLQTFRDGLAAGVRDIDLATKVESRLERFGVGHDGVTRTRGYAFVMSGPQTSQTHLDYEFSSARLQRAGDSVLMELAVVADGYWQDLSRIFVIGKPTDEQRRLYEVAEAAFQAAVKAAVPGATGHEVDRAARQVIEDAGLADAYPHQTGHGVGIAFHEQYPLLKPGSEQVLEAGNVIAIEPGVYIPGVGGVRNEDNLVVGDPDGARTLQTVPHAASVPGGRVSDADYLTDARSTR